MIDRRRFMGVAAMGAVAAACSPKPGDASPTSTTSTTPPPATTTQAPVPPDWHALRAQLPGGLDLPGDSGYPISARSYNPLFDNREPAAIAHCTSVADVQRCIDVARLARMPVAARSGGHSYAGYSTPDKGLVLDLRPMASVQVTGDTARIGAGARLMEVYGALADAGRALPAGSCPTVGIGGLTLGGGIGVTARKYGLTCDKLVSAQVVTADGEQHTVTDGDLLWALKGGGGGNFGVVTSFMFATEPAPDMTVFSLKYPSGATADVVGAWQEWIARQPDEMWSNCIVSAGSPPTCRVSGALVGDETTCKELLRTMPRASSVLIAGKGFLDAMRYFGDCSQRSIAQCRPESEGGQLGRASFTASSRMLNTAVDPAALVHLLDGRARLDVLLDGLGGAVARTEPGDTAFPHRKALASAQIYSSGGAQDVVEVRDGLGQLAGPHGYVNYIDATMPNWADAYYGDNLPRLRKVAATYDPDKVFTFAQAV
ncbi:FAD-binding oxidoreductase [Actinophytocola algeriensis]|uniref:FAD/FMN-containing dehydrogenase n=1 Tax=Actinophytocola algeriensis TaxID=1768010 RepID=A0A7W7QEF2_9PSEU|nr:FAD-binding oxidoreductase [Actinophytocola algeriensis]MBB4912082.1 FAD/FMN-containing dehydrogenase [Actinophytocola algeriensis]MBE1477426.1 FAD/FMN-containing dehydrogenase [Actinophytocola algeriensis]